MTLAFLDLAHGILYREKYHFRGLQDVITQKIVVIVWEKLLSDAT